jgi:diadenosine tetraphosphate (Ap4A) HIT family hydrolase
MKHGENPGEVSINESKERVVWESEHWIALMDRYPIVEGHVLILPKRETSHVTDLDDKQLNSLGEAIQEVSVLLVKSYGPGILVSMKCGEGSARTISHLHFHVIPRKKGDRLWRGDKSCVVIDRTSGFPRLKVSEKDLNRTASRIRGDSA